MNEIFGPEKNKRHQRNIDGKHVRNINKCTTRNKRVKVSCVYVGHVRNIFDEFFRFFLFFLNSEILLKWD